MTKVATGINNFARGKADHDLNARFDLPIYTSSSEIFRNFYSNFKGNAIYRPGLETIFKFQDCRFIEFKFSDEQDYIACAYNGKIRFLSYDSSGAIGWVLDSGSAILEVTSPYTLAHSKELSYDQNADVMYIAHNSYAPRKLTRVSANSFTLATFTRTADPFDDPSTGSVGWPACVRFYEGRLFYGGPGLKKVYVYGSVAGSYDDFTVPATAIEDDDAVIFAISDLTEAIKWLMNGSNSLIVGSSQALVAVNGGSVDDAITPTTVTAKITNTDGSDITQPLRKDTLIFYINALQRNVDYFSYDLLTETFKSDDANFISYDITKGGISKLVYIKGRNNLIFTVCDGKLLSLNFNLTEKIVGWHEHITTGTVLDIAKMYNPNTREDQLFVLVQRSNGVFIERLASEVEFPLKEDFYTDEESESADKEAYWRYVAELMKDCIYLDNSIVYKNLYTSTLTFNGTDTISSTASDFASTDVGRQIHYRTSTGLEKGIFEITEYTSPTSVKVAVLLTPTANSFSSWYKSFSSISGLTDYASMEVSIVGDGGYLGEETVSAGGVLTLDRQVTVACIGFKYIGLIKSFNLGFMMQGVNTQVLVKNINKAVCRFVASAGGEIGPSLYRMEPIQVFDPAGYYNLPPLPMDGDSKEIVFDDSYDKEKFIYFRQTEPVPLQLTGIFLTTNYGVSQ